MLYTDVDGQRDKLVRVDKLVTDDRQQFITLTVHLKLTASETIDVTTHMVGTHQNLTVSRDLTTPLSGMVCHPWASTYCRQPIYQI